ncbi:hypothetical protein LNAOJCKE_3249 [Methylorubrum aminovorans]|uniref:Uncharacterized protein n=1 Tax=Methylorubrum aminovorans TaxID=269069 RepID=A0ABQ4UJS7_9HYPH|nr:hypothetical protein [Methylorubrum aminovorans]GJE66035.1 hypothetical protein LNAOJCKE_3249 [Methylorubrum aminovorans]GMA78007.1 hypothetical protein GCM10025880_44240 [Methylorubrum aminovorans]
MGRSPLSLIIPSRWSADPDPKARAGDVQATTSLDAMARPRITDGFRVPPRGPGMTTRIASGRRRGRVNQDAGF